MWVLLVVQIVLSAIYLFMIGYFALGVIRAKKQSKKNEIGLPFSIVVAVRNEQENIDNLLESLLQLNYPAEKLEIILVNDHSTDETGPLARKWAEQGRNITLVELPANIEGKKQAIALGVSIAKNDTIILTDADCTHPKNWLQAIASKYQIENFDMLIGPVMLHPTNSLFEKMQTLEHASLTASTIGACSMDIPFMASSANLSFSKSRIGFSQQMLNPTRTSGDDVFLLHNAKQKRGVRIGCLNSLDTMVYTKPATTISAFLNQRARWASKATGYTDSTALAVGLIILLFNLLLVCLILLSFVSITYFKMLVIGFVVKSAADILLLYPYLKQQQRVSLLNVFLPLQLVYPVYIVVAFGLAMFAKDRWKERVRF